jgi:hypothetical protein
VNLKAFQEWIDYWFGENGQVKHFNSLLEEGEIRIPSSDIEKQVRIEGGIDGLEDCPTEETEVMIPGGGTIRVSIPQPCDCGYQLVGNVRVPDRFLAPIPAGIRIEDLFSEASLGFRTTVVTAPDSKLVRDLQTWDVSNQQWRAPDQGARFWDFVQRDKAYYLMEALRNNTTVSDSVTFVTFPISSVEENLDGKLFVSDLAGQTCIPNLAAEENSCFDLEQNNCIERYGTIEWLYRRSLKRFRASVKETDEFKLLFKYLFNVDRMFALNALYISTYVQSMQSSTTLFGGTKELLRIIFMAVLHSGDYTYTDPMTNKNLGMANFKNPDNGDAGGIDLVSLAINFPLMILKGITELIDPNIAVAKLITEASNKAAQAATDWAQEQGLTPKERCEAGYDVPDIPILPVSLGLMPMNIFPPPPFGPGIGPPVSPLWPYYMGVFNGISPDPLAGYSSKQRSRLSNTCESDRDFTKNTQCDLNNTEED